MTLAEPTVPPTAPSFGQRIVGALTLSPRIFSAIEHDPHALWQAALVVCCAGAARGAGVYGTEGVEGLVGSTAVGVFLWLVGGTLVWAIGVYSLKGKAAWLEVLRTIGFATAPLLLLALRAFGIAPLDTPLWIVGHVWAMASLTIATREALDVDTSRALAACILALSVGLFVLATVGPLVISWGAFD